MPDYYAIVDQDENSAYGAWFPEVEGCFSAADTADDIVPNAAQALQLHLEGVAAPPARSKSELSRLFLGQLTAGAYFQKVHMMDFGDPMRLAGGPHRKYLDIYVDNDFEEVMFRWDHKLQKYFRKFYGADGEDTVPNGNSLRFASFSYGDEITREEYERGK